MKSPRLHWLALIAALTVPALAQDVGNVAPASLPLPLPGAAPMAPDQLRARNPWNLPVTGTWKFQLTHGRINAAKEFVLESPAALESSSSQGENPAINAVDGDPATRWCASGPDVPQWIEADLGQVRRVQSLDITWEKPETRYQFRVEARTDPKGAWKTLAQVAAPGKGDGPIAIAPADARYLRVTVTGVSDRQWACIREMKIGTLENGKLIAWKPPAPDARAVPVAVRDAFAAPGFKDASWDSVSVPSNWEMLGYSIPTYDSVDNTVGLYRRTIDVPKTWAGRRVYWRFDGALDGAEVWVNGQKAGYHESGYTAFQVDVTDYIRAGQTNFLAARVSKTTPSFDADTGDYQTMGGIYRATSLVCVPQTHVGDITVTTPLAANYRDATLNARAQVMGVAGQTVALSGTLVGSDGAATDVQMNGQGTVGADGTAEIALSAPIAAPQLWSAEHPNLYYVVLQLSANGQAVERVQQRFGFKQIEVKNNVVLWNGVPIKLTGICRHDFWSDKGFALTDKEWNQDLDMMKAANINAVRTSHYNHAARFLELCDEKGMYILDEVPYCWINDQVKDPAYAPFLVQRAAETLARDKNKPCVVAWSLGNENPMGVASQITLDYVRKTDPSRPAFVSGQDPESAPGQQWKDDHYPGPDTVAREASLANVRWPYNYTEHPHTFYEKEAQEYDPGVSDLWSETLIKTWDMIYPAPQILGSFIWEWQSQGVADKYPDSTRQFWFGLDHLRQENNKGIVDGYRNPKPELWFVKMAYSPVVVGARSVGAAGAVPLTNHYSFTNLNELNCRWTASNGAKTLASGAMKINCAPLQSVVAKFPMAAGATKLRLDFVRADGSSVVAANLPVAGAPLPPPPAALAAGNAVFALDGADSVRVGNSAQEIVFAKNSGAIRSWRVGQNNLLVGGPIVNLGGLKGGNENGYFQAKTPPVTSNARITTAPGINGALRVNVVSDVKNGDDGAALGTLNCVYDIAPDAEMRVSWKLDWTAPDTRLWESGLKLVVPSDFKTMKWSRESYFLDYPAGHLGEPQGICRAGDVQFRASKRDLHWLTLTNARGAGVALLAQDDHLVSRANVEAGGNILFASSQVAGVRGLSGSWVDDHRIDAKKGGALAGEFVLRALR